jgi:hypothetical protein
VCVESGPPARAFVEHYVVNSFNLFAFHVNVSVVVSFFAFVIHFTSKQVAPWKEKVFDECLQPVFQALTLLVLKSTKYVPAFR